MAIVRNAKKKDFDYYLTNLDWDDGSPIERDIKQFDRNDVFDHTYERPGFYSIKGLVFKFEKVMLDAVKFGHEKFVPIINSIEKLAKKAGKPKWEVEEVDHSSVKKKISDKFEEIVVPTHDVTEVKLSLIHI